MAVTARGDGSDVGEDAVEGAGDAGRVERFGQDSPVTDLAARTDAQETLQLLLAGPVALGGLAAEGTERPELALRGDDPLDRGGAEGADQLVFQVGDAHVEAEPFQVVEGRHRAEARAGQ